MANFNREQIEFLQALVNDDTFIEETKSQKRRWSEQQPAKKKQRLWH